jgi:hypothetical protein
MAFWGRLIRCAAEISLQSVRCELFKKMAGTKWPGPASVEKDHTRYPDFPLRITEIDRGPVGDSGVIRLSSEPL